MTRIRFLSALRWALTFVLVIQGLYFCRELSALPSSRNEDTQNYLDVAQRLRDHDWKVIWTNNRPPGYPLILLGADAVGVEPRMAAVALNRCAILLLLFALPLAAHILVVSGALTLLFSFSTFVSNENVLMTESVIPFFLIVSCLLAALARRSFYKSPTSIRWPGIILLNTLFLQSLKPSFKLFTILEMAWFLLRTRSKQAGLLIWSTTVLLILVLNLTLLKSGGKLALTANKSHIMTLVPCELTPEEQRTMPKSTHEIYLAYKKHWDMNPKDFNGIVISYEAGAELFDYAFLRHWSVFLKAGGLRVFNFFKYSGWTEDWGKLQKRVGIPLGFGVKPFFLSVFGLGLLSALLFSFNWQKTSEVIEPLTSFVVSGIAIVVLITGIDVGRISLQWIIALYPLLTLLSWGFFDRILHLKKIRSRVSFLRE